MHKRARRELLDESGDCKLAASRIGCQLRGKRVDVLSRRTMAWLLVREYRRVAPKAEEDELFDEQADARCQNSWIGEHRVGGDRWKREHCVRLLAEPLIACEMLEPLEKRLLTSLARFDDAFPSSSP